MSTTLSGPMFEPAVHGPWQATSCECGRRKSGAHYNSYTCRDASGMDALRTMFPDGEADYMNFVLFSTSGVHGTYGTIEEAEAMIGRGFKYDDGEDGTPSVTFLIVHARIVCVRYGNCEPCTEEDIAFLKKLRASSWAVIPTIGASEQE